MDMPATSEFTLTHCIRSRLTARSSKFLANGLHTKFTELSPVHEEGERWPNTAPQLELKVKKATQSSQADWWFPRQGFPQTAAGFRRITLLSIGF
jgi:hypothetical protein